MLRAFLTGLLLCYGVAAQPDLVAPFTVDLLSSSHALWDTIEVTTWLINKGDLTAWSPLYPSDYTALSLGFDSLQLRNHSIPYLDAGYYVEFIDTLVVMKAPFCVVTWCAPLGEFGEGGGQKVNNVRGVAFDFYPETVYDTTYILVYDTVIVHDTTVTTDTLVMHDTVVVHDTVYATGSTPKFASATLSAEGEYTEVYRMDGRMVWHGALREGQLPPVRLAMGTHVLVCGDRRGLLKVVPRTGR